MKYALSCFLAMVVAVSLNIGAPESTTENENKNEVQKIEVRDFTGQSQAVELTEADRAFENDNPIVYQALSDLEESFDKLCVLEESGVNVGAYKQDICALADFIRVVGIQIKVEEVSLPGKSLNSAETVVYRADAGKGAWITNAAGYASYKEVMAEDGVASDGTVDNAKKHAKWSATATILSEDALYTKYFTDAHEFGHPLNFANAENFYDSDMDMKNNAIGREIGQELREKGKFRAMKALDSRIEQESENLITLK